MNENLVTFDLLLRLAAELDDSDLPPIQKAIFQLATSDVPMSDAVIELGVITDVLDSDYKNDWSHNAKEN